MARRTRERRAADDGRPSRERRRATRDYEASRAERPAARTDEPAEAPPPVPPVVVPRWVQLVLLPLALLGLWALARAAGTVLLILIIAARHRADPQPARRAARSAATCRAGLAVLAVYLGFFVALAGIGVAAGQPDLQPGAAASSNDVPHSSTRPTDDLANFQHWLNRQRASTSTSASRARPRCRRSRTTSLKRSGDIVSFGADLLTQIVQRRLRPGPDLRAVGLHAPLRRADRRAGAADHAARATARRADDYPTLVQRAVSATSAGSCCSA